MSLKIKIEAKGHYAEESQPNPMQWLMLYKEGDTYYNNSAWLKCKDFFNDYAYAKHTGKPFGIYGFNPGTMKVQPKDAKEYMLLRTMTPQFPDNMAVLNDWLTLQKMPPIPFQKHNAEWLIEFDPVYFTNTYYISLISLIIRLMNVEKKFVNFDGVIAHKDFATKDQGKWDQVVAAKHFFKIPAKYQKYLWFCGPERNSEKTESSFYGISSLVHNCGVLEWTKWFAK